MWCHASSSVSSSHRPGPATTPSRSATWTCGAPAGRTLPYISRGRCMQSRFIHSCMHGWSRCKLPTGCNCNCMKYVPANWGCVVLRHSFRVDAATELQESEDVRTFLLGVGIEEHGARRTPSCSDVRTQLPSGSLSRIIRIFCCTTELVRCTPPVH